MGNMLFFQLHLLRSMDLRHAWVGFNIEYATLDGLHHAVDFYWQERHMILAGIEGAAWYHHLLLLDVSELENWYRCTRMWHFRDSRQEFMAIEGVQDQYGVMRRSFL